MGILPAAYMRAVANSAKNNVGVVLQAKQDKSVRAKQDTKREQGNGGEGRGVCPWKEG